MKKIISLIVACMMLISTVMSSGIYSSAEMLYGEGDIDYVEALYFENSPAIDGYISEAEWGEATVELHHDWCATKDDARPYYNSFFYWKTGTLDENPMEVQVWLRWDEAYYYVGVKVKDFDGHSLAHNQSNTWNGDALQFRVDSEGPNASTGGEEYDPAIGTPWSDDYTVPNFVVGYTQIAGGYFECYENTNGIGLTAYDSPVFGEALVAVSPSEQYADDDIGYHEDSMAGYTTYEVAVPWKYIFENHLVPNYYWLTEEECAPYILDYSEYNFKNNPNGGIGYTLGMSLTVFNAQKDSNSWTSFMSWGSGTTNMQINEAHQTCAGSNCVTLSAEKVEQSEYDVYDPSELERDDGVAEYDSVFYDYLGDDTARRNPLDSYEDLMVLTYDDPVHMDFWGSRELYQGSLLYTDEEHGMSLNYDRMLETKVDEWGIYRFEGIDAIDQFYIDTRLNAYTKLTYPLSYTFEFDIKYTGNEIVQRDEPSRLGLWFGGADGYSYYCGYSFEYEAFVISESSGAEEILYIGFADFEKNEWSNWKFQYDNDTYTVRFYVDDRLVFNVTDRNFYCSNSELQEDGTMLIMWFLNTQMKMDNIKIYNFYDFLKNPVGDTYSISGAVTSYGEETPITAYLYDIYSGEELQQVTVDPETSEYMFENVASGEYFIFYEKAKHVIEYAWVSVDGADATDVDVTLYLIGDVDLNGVVAGTDIISLSQAIKNDEYVSFYYDIDGDFALTATDLMYVAQIIKGTFDYEMMEIPE